MSANPSFPTPALPAITISEKGPYGNSKASVGYCLVSFPILVGGRTTHVLPSKTPGHVFVDGGGETTEVKIAGALSAAPDDIAKAARVVDTDANGKTIVLREGANGFTCMPGNLQTVGVPPMCEDAASMQRGADFKARKPKPTNSVPGITYMLAGATQRSDSNPYDKTSPPIAVGPHWMIM